MNAETLEQIQTRIAYLERANSELSDVVFRQHRDIEALRAQVARLAARMDAAAQSEPARTLEEERPPHY
jgi:SlyX protein